MNWKGMVHGSSADFIFLRYRKFRSYDADPRLAGWWVRASFHIRSPVRRPSMGVIKTNCQCFLSLSQTNAVNCGAHECDVGCRCYNRGGSWASDREDMTDCQIHMTQHTVCLLKCSDRSCVFTLRCVCSAFGSTLIFFLTLCKKTMALVEGGRLKSSRDTLKLFTT